MSKLPNADKAIVPLEKFSEYMLNPNHRNGKHKARVFEAVLGLTIEDAEFLQETLKSVASSHDATQQESIAYGARYVIDFELTTTKGSAKIRSAWMVRKDEDFPRLTTCYVMKDSR